MLPTPLLPQLSPAAAKLYLVLLSLRRSASTIQANLPTLIELSALSASTCKRALRQLQNLQLLRRLPRRYHAPNTFAILIPTPPTNSSPMTSLPPTKSSPMTPNPPSNGSPMTPVPHVTPITNSKTPNSSPMTPLLNPSELANADPELIKLIKLESALRILKEQLHLPGPTLHTPPPRCNLGI